MVVKRLSEKYNSFFKIVLFCMFAFSLLIGIFLTVSFNAASKNNASEIKYIEKWTVVDETGKSFETGRTYNDDRAYNETFTLITKLPDKIELDQILCFQNRSNVYVYINGELRKKFDRIKDTGIPGGSIKEFYINVPLTPPDSGGELKIIREKTDWNPFVVSETFVTTHNGIYKYMAGRYGFSFALTIVLFIASFLAAIVALVMMVWNKQNIDMLYAALGILDVSFWLISVSQFTPYITGIYYVDGVMGFLFCMMMPFALIIYINSIQKGRYKKIYTALFLLSLVNFILWSLLHFTGIFTFQSALIYIDSVLGIIVLSVIVTLFMDIKNRHIKDYKYTSVGFLIFMVMAIVEIVILVFFENDYTQISMIIGLICLLVSVAFQQVDDIKRVREHLEAEVRKKIEENQQMLIHIVQTLAGTIDAKDTYTNGHSSRVADYSREIARRFGYSESEMNDIYMMGLLHDIGKIGVPDAVINKPGRLTDEEFEIIKKHPVMGANILKNITEKKELAIGARSHHERYSGGGYPDGIKGEEIPEQARIIAVADSYDAMTSYRSYRDPMPQEKVKFEIMRGRGTQFDPRFADIMLQMMADDKNYDLRERRAAAPVTPKQP